APRELSQQNPNRLFGVGAAIIATGVGMLQAKLNRGRRIYASGSVIVTLVPFPTALSTFTLPPCISTNFFTTLAPSPSPRRPCSYVPDECRVTSNPVKNASP